jgi:hypothetical protein
MPQSRNNINENSSKFESEDKNKISLSLIASKTTKSKITIKIN